MQNQFTYAKASVGSEHTEGHDVEPPLVSFCFYPTANSANNDVIEVCCIHVNYYIMYSIAVFNIIYRCTFQDYKTQYMDVVPFIYSLLLKTSFFL